MLHSIYDLTTSCRKTAGDVPAKLVGASTTVVGSKMYLFGGRLVTERRMVSDLYAFDLETFVWEKITPFPEDDLPKPRYFHSADAWNNQLIIFGGMSNQPNSPNADELCVLNDVRFFDLATRHWLPQSQFPAPVSDTFVPRARYAHLSSITADRLFIIGGQDFYNTWLDDVCVYDLLGKAWVQRRDYPRHCGTYRSVAVSSNLCVRLPQIEARASQASANFGPPGARFREAHDTPSLDFTPSETLVHLPYSATPTEEHPSDIYLYSNYNFTDVKRELEVFSPLPDTDFTVQDRSTAMSGHTLPPGLRFPTGAILGTHLIIAGTYLAHSYQSFSIWVLDLLTMTWARIDPGKAVETGSWFRGCVWPESNKFLIFGNRNGNLVDDYNRRLLSWDHVAVVDLEAFGIYQPPPLRLDLPMQELGLAALEEKTLADFEIICDDGRRIACSRRLLEDRWPWFKEQRKKLLETALMTSDQLPTSPMHVKLPDLPGAIHADERRPDPRLTPRALHLSEPYPITLALLQYFYTLALLTPLQLAPAVLSQLLVLATNYQIPHLESLVKHAMHRALCNSTSVGVYEVATLCGCRSLQIRALKTVMSYTQKRPRRDKETGGGGGRPPDSGAGGGGPGPSNGHDDPSGGSRGDRFISRPRGTSDAKWRTATVENGAGNYSHNYAKFPLPSHPNNYRSTHDRHTSAVSVRTDDELHDVADLLGAALLEPRNSPRHDRAKSEDMYEALVDPSIAHSDSESVDEISRPTTAEFSSDARSHRSYIAESITSFSISEYELLSVDGSVERVYLPPEPTFASFHLPLSRLAPIYTGSHDNSDTPSLISHKSRSSLGSSTSHVSPLTPGIYTPSEYLDPAPLPVIVERQFEDQAWERWRHDRDSESVQAMQFSSKSDSPAIIPMSPSEVTSRPWPKQPSTLEWKVPKSGRRSSEDVEVSTITPAHDPPPTPKKTGTTSSFSRLLRKDKETRVSKYETSQLPLDSKALKAEEKKRKKEEAKAKTERLARELKASSQARARQAADSNSLNSQERKKKDPGAMFGGMAGIVM